MAQKDREENPNKSRGRANAPGLDKQQTYVNDEGHQITVTKREWHDSFKEQGYRPLDEGNDNSTAPAEAPAEGDA